MTEVHQLSFLGLAPLPGFRRQYCRCGCGTWFYDPLHTGTGRRPKLYANPDHYRDEYNRRKRERYPRQREELNRRRRERRRAP
jgi:hypothetical protein